MLLTDISKFNVINFSMKNLWILTVIVVLSACNSTKKVPEAAAVAEVKDSAITILPPIIVVDSVKTVITDSLAEKGDEKTEEATQHGIVFKVIPSVISLKNVKEPIYSVSNTTSKTMRTGRDYELEFLNEKGNWEKFEFEMGVLDTWIGLEKNKPPYTSPLTWLITEIIRKPGTYKICKEIEVFDPQTRERSKEIVSATFEIVE